MQSQREAMTDSLADIINIIHLGGKSGVLTVERGEAATLEEGLIIFVDGKVIEAKAGQKSALTAFRYLTTWKTCRFSFIDQYVQDVPMSSQNARTALSQRENTPAPPSTSSGSLTTPIPPALKSGAQEYSGKSAEPSTQPLRSQTGELALQSPERMQISRMQRRLLLLINGQRSLSELARLMAKSPDEVKLLLDDLERSGLISQ